MVNYYVSGSRNIEPLEPASSASKLLSYLTVRTI